MTTANKAINRTHALLSHSMKNQQNYICCMCIYILTTHNKQNMPELLTHSTDGATIKSTQNQLWTKGNNKINGRQNTRRQGTMTHVNHETNNNSDNQQHQQTNCTASANEIKFVHNETIIARNWHCWHTHNVSATLPIIAAAHGRRYVTYMGQVKSISHKSQY